MRVTDMIVPLIIMLILLHGILKKTDVTEDFTKGAAEGLRTAAGLVPMLVLMLTAVGMFTSYFARSRKAGLPAGMRPPCAYTPHIGQRCPCSRQRTV